MRLGTEPAHRTLWAGYNPNCEPGQRYEASICLTRACLSATLTSGSRKSCEQLFIYSFFMLPHACIAGLTFMVLAMKFYLDRCGPHPVPPRPNQPSNLRLPEMHDFCCSRPSGGSRTRPCPCSALFSLVLYINPSSACASLSLSVHASAFPLPFLLPFLFLLLYRFSGRRACKAGPYHSPTLLPGISSVCPFHYRAWVQRTLKKIVMARKGFRKARVDAILQRWE